MPLKYFLSPLSPRLLLRRLRLAFVHSLEEDWRQSGRFQKFAHSPHDFIGRVFKLLFALVVAVVLAFSFLPQVYRYAVLIGCFVLVCEIHACIRSAATSNHCALRCTGCHHTNLQPMPLAVRCKVVRPEPESQGQSTVPVICHAMTSEELPVKCA